MQKSKKYHPNVAATVLSPAYPSECGLFVGKRSDMEDIQQFPRGGINEGENAKETLFRELKEEIGTKELKLIAEYPKWLSYSFPSKVASKMYPYDGRIQKHFLVRLKPNAKIGLNTKHPEFDGYRFVSKKELFELVSHFKKGVYVKVTKYFKEKGCIQC